MEHRGARGDAERPPPPYHFKQPPLQYERQGLAVLHDRPGKPRRTTLHLAPLDAKGFSVGPPPRWQRFALRSHAPGERFPDFRRALDCLRGRLRDASPIPKLVEQIAGGALEPLEVLSAHLGPPVPQAWSDRKPGMLGVKAGLVPGSALVESEHFLLVRHSQKRAQSRAFLGR